MTNLDHVREAVLGALARGYCSKENEHKIVDPTLIQAMAVEVEKEIASLKGELAEARRRCEDENGIKVTKTYYQHVSNVEAENAALREKVKELEVKCVKLSDQQQLLLTNELLKQEMKKADIKNINLNKQIQGLIWEKRELQSELSQIRARMGSMRQEIAKEVRGMKGKSSCVRKMYSCGECHDCIADSAKDAAFEAAAKKIEGGE